MTSILCALVVLPVGCEEGSLEDGGTADALVIGDAASARDAGASDAGGLDAGAPDAGRVDGAAPDGGTVPCSPVTASPGPVFSDADYDVYALTPVLAEEQLFCEINAPVTTPQAFSLPFDLPYFGETIAAGTTVTVTESGQISFGTPSDVINEPLPRASGEGGIAAFWDDLLAGGLCVGSSRDRVVVGWRVVRDLSFVGEGRVEIQAELYPSGEIHLILWGEGDAALSATIGMDARDRSLGIQLPCSPDCAADDVPTPRRYVFRPRGLGPLSRVLPVCAPAVPSPLYPDDLLVYDGQTVRVRKTGAEPNPGRPIQLVIGPRSTFVDLVATSPTAVVAAPSVVGLLDGETADLTFSLEEAGAAYLAPGLPPPGSHSAFLGHVDDLVYLGPLEVLNWLGTISFTTPETLPTASVGVASSLVIGATGSPSPTFELISPPTALPPGLSLAADGTLSGTPTAAGTYRFRVAATELHYREAVRRFAIRIR